MELPLSVMDSALFYRRRMGLAREEALQLCVPIVANAKRFGGTLVINWHDRSLAPERLWGRFYRNLFEEVTRDNRVWFATAGEAVDWFRWRRSIRFTEDTASGAVTVAALAPQPAGLAGVIRINKPARTREVAIDERRFDGHDPVKVEL
jgi:hypothetical protein